MKNLFFTPKDYLKILKQMIVPNAAYETVEDIPMERLFERGFNTAILDVDNTLVNYHERTIGLQKGNWISQQKLTGFDIYLVSNNLSKRRIKRICEQLEVQGIYRAAKPFTFAIKDLAEKNYFDLTRTIVIGDQVFTDILMGNWLKANTILVDPVDKKLSFIKTLQREIEIYLLKKLKNLKVN